MAKVNVVRATAMILVVSVLGLTQSSSFTPAVRQFVSVDAPVIALTHVRVIDGTGRPANEDQTVVIEGGKIRAVGRSSDVQTPAGARVLDLSGHTVIPGLVGMHNHMFYPAGSNPAIYPTMVISFPRLYLALGVTTIRTAGSMEPYTDLNVKKLIDEGQMPGPRMFVTGPYLEGQGSPILQLHKLSGPEDARKLVNYWADLGVTSFKAYQYIKRDELRAAVEEAHKRGLKVTGHLCSIGFQEAAEIGIDNLEHGFHVDTEFTPGKKADQCPPAQETRRALAALEVNDRLPQETIRVLVDRKVAITTTPIVSEVSLPNRPMIPSQALDVMSPQARANFLLRRAQAAETPDPLSITLFRKGLEFHRAFSRAGGLLVLGLDPTGNGGAIPGFGDLRNVELLVEGGFSTTEAIKVATANGAELLGESSRFGTIAAGKQADLVVIRGNPAANIAEIRNVNLVFKDGIGYDSSKLIDSVRGMVGLQ